jgi:single-strand DNA-binding protein
MNSISLVGRLCESPELKQTNNGKSVVSTTLAVDRPHTKDVTDFIPVVIWNQSAEYLGKYASKGTKVAITGKLTIRKYEDKNGNKRTAFEVVADTVEICDSAKESSTEAKNEPYVPTPYSTENAQSFETVSGNESLPF